MWLSVYLCEYIDNPKHGERVLHIEEKWAESSGRQNVNLAVQQCCIQWLKRGEGIFQKLKLDHFNTVSNWS